MNNPSLSPTNFPVRQLLSDRSRWEFRHCNPNRFLRAAPGALSPCARSAAVKECLQRSRRSTPKPSCSRRISHSQLCAHMNILPWIAVRIEYFPKRGAMTGAQSATDQWSRDEEVKHCVHFGNQNNRNILTKTCPAHSRAASLPHSAMDPTLRTVVFMHSAHCLPSLPAVSSTWPSLHLCIIG